MALGDEVAIVNGSNDPTEESKDPVETIPSESSPSKTECTEPLTEENAVTEDAIVVEQANSTEEIPADVEEAVESNGTPADAGEQEEVESVPVEEEEDEEDLIDPIDDIREECKAGSDAVKMAQILEECQNRVGSRSNTEETCHEEMIDFVHAVDHCMAKSIFGKLK